MTHPGMTDETFVTSEHAVRWSNILGRITDTDALDFDAVIGSHDRMLASRPGRCIFPDGVNPPLTASLTDQRPAIGVLVDRVDDRHATAIRLAALALERDCEIIVLTEQPISGVEKFGFRVERIAGDTKTERSACLKQLEHFWGLEIII